MAGISSKAIAVGQPENKKKYQQYEFNDDLGINLNESFYRLHDPQIGRFWQSDPKPDFSKSVYSAMDDDPLLIIDPLGDTTWVYDLLGNQIDVINNKKTKNQIHFIDAKNYADLKKKDKAENLEADVRKKSTAFFGSNSAKELKKIVFDQKRSMSGSDGGEAAVGVSINKKTRELQFKEIKINDKYRGPLEIAFLDQAISEVLTKSQEIALFGAGHTHQTTGIFNNSIWETLKETAVPSSRSKLANDLSDFNHLLYRSNSGDQKAKSALFIGARVGFSVYSSGWDGKYPTVGNGMFLYSQFK